MLGYADDVPPLFLFSSLNTSFAIFEVFGEHLRRSSSSELLLLLSLVHFAWSSFTSVNTFDRLLRRTSMPSNPRLGIQEPSPRITVLFIYLYLTIFCI